MQTFTTNDDHLVIRLDTGDMMLESIRAACEEHAVTDGTVVSGIGTLRNLHVHYLHADIETGEKDDRNTFLELDGCWEISGIDGLVADGEPHLHLTAYDGERTVVGHLEEGNEVNALGEVVVRELDGADLTRRPNEFDVSMLERR
jgi:predicted DNA-binding protein with PD1-like motif